MDTFDKPEGLTSMVALMEEGPRPPSPAGRIQAELSMSASTIMPDGIQPGQDCWDSLKRARWTKYVCAAVSGLTTETDATLEEIVRTASSLADALLAAEEERWKP